MAQQFTDRKLVVIGGSSGMSRQTHGRVSVPTRDGKPYEEIAMHPDDRLPPGPGPHSRPAPPHPAGCPGPARAPRPRPGACAPVLVSVWLGRAICSAA